MCVSRADLWQLLARVTPHADLFDADFRLLLGFFVLNNFSALLRYHEQRARIGQLGIDRTAMVRAMVAVLPCEARKLEARPSRWRHWGVPPVDAASKEALAAVVNTVRQDKLAGWFVYPVTALDFTAPDPVAANSVLVDYWPITQFPMSLEIIAARLDNNFYVSPEECVSDLRLTFCNAMRYNHEDSEIYRHACALYMLTNKLYAKVAPQLVVPVQPFERGTVDDFVDVTSPRLLAQVEAAFMHEHGPNPNDTSYDPTAPGPVPPRGGGGGGSKKGKSKAGGSAAKRGRKELKVSGLLPCPLVCCLSRPLRSLTGGRSRPMAAPPRLRLRPSASSRGAARPKRPRR